jgi:hypothetical protein
LAPQPRRPALILRVRFYDCESSLGGRMAATFQLLKGPESRWVFPGPRTLGGKLSCFGWFFFAIPVTVPGVWKRRGAFHLRPSVSCLPAWETKTGAEKKPRRHPSRSLNPSPDASARSSLRLRRSRAFYHRPHPDRLAPRIALTRARCRAPVLKIQVNWPAHSTRLQGRCVRIQH